MEIVYPNLQLIKHNILRLFIFDALNKPGKGIAKGKGKRSYPSYNVSIDNGNTMSLEKVGDSALP